MGLKKHMSYKHRDISTAVDRVRKRYPDGFSKKDLIKCHREVEDETYGKFGSGGPGLGVARIVTREDLSHAHNALVATGSYPASMSECEVVGLSGNCGDACPLFQRGGCEHIENGSAEGE